jgi:filamentous hemagglutinin
LGVKNSGNIVAQVGEVVITQDGRLENFGAIHGQKAVQIETYDSVENQGRIQSTDKVEVQTAKGLANQGQIVANQSIGLKAEDDLVNSGLIQSGGELELVSAKSITNTGDVLAQSTASVKATKEVANSGSLQSFENLTVDSGKSLTNSGDILALSSVAIKTTDGVNNSGDIQSADSLIIQAGTTLDNNESGIITGQVSLIETANLQNQGLLDGGDVVIKAASDIVNIYTGTILGDHLALEAQNILNGLPITIADGRTESHSGLLGARARLDTAVSGELINRENGYIFSGGDWYIGLNLDSSHQATGQGGQVTNSSAVIDVVGSLFADVNLLSNLNDHYLTQLEVIQNYNWLGYRFEGDPVIYISGEPTIYLDGYPAIKLPGESGGGFWAGGVDDHATGGGHSSEDFFFYQVNRVVQDTKVIDSRPGFIQVGGDMTVTGSLVNDKSVLEVPGGTLSVNGSFTNIKAIEPTIITDAGSFHWTYVGWNSFATSHKREHGSSVIYHPAPVSVLIERKIVLDDDNPFAYSPAAQAGTNVIGNLNGLNANLYTINPSLTSSYLVETNPRLTNYRLWLSSDFMLDRLNADPLVVHKRLGDGFYEQRLVREQIANLTGLGILSEYSSEEEQYRALMLAGVDFAEEFGLELGLSLSAEQMALLTSDIVWLEYVTVETADGPVQVLAPKVYLRPGQEPLLTAEGGLVSAKNVVMDLAGEFNNFGNLLAGELLRRWITKAVEGKKLYK